jgi:hypothetical protein
LCLTQTQEKGSRRVYVSDMISILLVKILSSLGSGEQGDNP